MKFFDRYSTESLPAPIAKLTPFPVSATAFKDTTVGEITTRKVFVVELWHRDGTRFSMATLKENPTIAMATRQFPR
jgi:hypothetical protein